jgi:hypothetical protein
MQGILVNKFHTNTYAQTVSVVGVVRTAAMLVLLITRVGTTSNRTGSLLRELSDRQTDGHALSLLTKRSKLAVREGTKLATGCAKRKVRGRS